MKKIIFFLAIVFSTLLKSQSAYHFQPVDDGSLFCWVNEGTRDYGITVCPAESLYLASTHPHPTFSMHVVDASMSGNGKYLFWNTGKEMFRATYHPDGLTDTVRFDYSGDVSRFAYDISYDGTQVTACYDAPTLPKRCSPGFRMLMNFQLKDGEFVVTDTLSPADTCHFVSTSSILPNGWIFWSSYKDYQMMRPTAPGKYEPVTFLTQSPVHRTSFVIPQNGNSIFIQGYIDDPDSKKDSIFCLYECRFVNGAYTDPILIRQWKNAPQWQKALTVSPDGMHLVWINGEKDGSGVYPTAEDVMVMHWNGTAWSEPEVLFSQFHPASHQGLGNWAVMSNRSICWHQYNSSIVYCAGLHAGATVLTTSLLPTKWGRTPWKSENIVLRDTLMEKEFFLVRLRYTNTTNDTLSLSYYTSYAYINNARLIPTHANSWSSVTPDFSELSLENQTPKLGRLAPGDSVEIPYMVSFNQSGEIKGISIYVKGDSIAGEVAWYVRAGVVIRDTRRSAFEPFVDHRGVTREQCTRDGSSFILKSWYENGLLRYETRFDAKCRPEGTWKYFSDRGVLLEEKRFYGKNSYSVKTWYHNGQLKSSGAYHKTCKIGTWKEYYETGQRKSETKFRRMWTLHIYQRNHTTDVLLGTYAHSYTEWYPNGQKKMEAAVDMDGLPKGIWYAWYEDGQLNATYSYNKKKRVNMKRIYDHNGTCCFDSGLQSNTDPSCPDPFAGMPQLHFEKRSPRALYGKGF